MNGPPLAIQQQEALEGELLAALETLRTRAAPSEEELWLLAFLELRAGDQDASLRTLEHLQAREVHSAALDRQMANAHWYAGRYRRARDHLEALVQQAPGRELDAGVEADLAYLTEQISEFDTLAGQQATVHHTFLGALCLVTLALLITLVRAVRR